MQTTVDAVCQQVSPDPPCTVGPIVSNETHLDLLADGFDPARTADPLYADLGETYVRLDAALYTRISSGLIRV